MCGVGSREGDLVMYVCQLVDSLRKKPWGSGSRFRLQSSGFRV
jgi:hypothetical protein